VCCLTEPVGTLESSANAMKYWLFPGLRVDAARIRAGAGEFEQDRSYDQCVMPNLQGIDTGYAAQQVIAASRRENAPWCCRYVCVQQSAAVVADPREPAQSASRVKEAQ
jgi:hypothetical protein